MNTGEGLAAALDRFSRTPLPKVRQRGVSALVEIESRLESIGEKVDRPKPDELVEICRRIGAALSHGEPLNRRDLRRAPWCLWAPDMPLAENADWLKKILGLIIASGRERLFKILALAWAHAFAVDRPGIVAVGHFLEERSEMLGPKWANALTRWSIFDVQRGPNAIAETATAQHKPIEAVLIEAGLAELTTCQGFTFEIYKVGLALLERGALKDPEIRLATLDAWTFDVQRKLRHPALVASIVRAAIEPFGDVMPEKGIRDRYTNFTLSLLGDPRSQASRWVNCRRAQEIVRRWLTEQTLRQFFDVVDRIAAEEHWNYRRAFWHALYAGGHIDDAWAVFEYRGQVEARRMFGKELGFGTFSTSGAEAGHAVLLLRIGTLTVAEWSHRAPCGIWDSNADEKGPKLGDPRYSTGELRKPFSGSTSGANLSKQGVFWHRGSDKYTWQGLISDYLKRRRGITLMQRDYRV